MQHPDDANAVDAYCQTQPDFGGVYYDGDQLVVLFTGDLDRHGQDLATVLDHPDQARVAQTTRTWAEVEDTNRTVQARLLTEPAPIAGVTSVGIGLSDGAFVIEVGVDQLDDAIIAAVHAAAAPHTTHIRQEGRPRRY
jgi:hypothetical protein